MFAKLALISSVLVSSVFAAGAMINTPATLTQCQPTALSWAGGVAPYFLAVIPGGNAQGAPLLNFGEQTGTSYTWIVNITSGTSVSLAITDSTGAINYSSPVTILAGTSSSCIGAQAAVVSSAAATGAATSAAAPKTSAAAASVTSAAAATTAAAPVVASAASGSASAAASTAAGTAAAVTPKPTSGASTLTVSSLLVAAAFAFML